MMAVRFYVQVAFPDNGGLVINGPIAEGSKHGTVGKKMYISETLDPEKVGALFLAFHADLKLSGSVPIDLDNIEF